MAKRNPSTAGLFMREKLSPSHSTSTSFCASAFCLASAISK
jgi:hypothetical protein